MRLSGRGVKCIRGGREVFSGLDFAASAGEALMKEPTPRRVSITPARSSSAYTRATVLALTRSSTASWRTVGS